MFHCGRLIVISSAREDPRSRVFRFSKPAHKETKKYPLGLSPSNSAKHRYLLNKQLAHLIGWVHQNLGAGWKAIEPSGYSSAKAQRWISNWLSTYFRTQKRYELRSVLPSDSRLHVVDSRLCSLIHFN